MKKKESYRTHQDHKLLWGTWPRSTSSLDETNSIPPSLPPRPPPPPPPTLPRLPNIREEGLGQLGRYVYQVAQAECGNHDQERYKDQYASLFFRNSACYLAVTLTSPRIFFITEIVDQNTLDTEIAEIRQVMKEKVVELEKLEGGNGSKAKAFQLKGMRPWNSSHIQAYRDILQHTPFSIQ